MCVDMYATSPIDTEHLERVTFGDNSLAREVLRLFCVQAPELLALLQAGDPQPHSVVHRLKGSALAIGATGVVEVALDLEERARSGQLDPADFARLSAAVGAVVEWYNQQDANSASGYF